MENKFRKFALITIISLITIAPIVLMGVTFNLDSLESNRHPIESDLNSSFFSAEDYVPILDEPFQGLGNISVTRFTFDQSGFYNDSGVFPNIAEDINSGALNINYLKTNFIENVKVAQFNNLDESVPQSTTITILLNESISVQSA